MGDSSIAVMELAGLFHDPPWKPWAITGLIAPLGKESGLDRIKDALVKIVSPHRDNEVLKLCDSMGDVSGIIEEAWREVKGLGEGSSGVRLKAHELQGLFFLRLLVGIVSRGAPESSAGRVFNGAYRLLKEEVLGKKGPVSWGDWLASAVDRFLIRGGDDEDVDNVSKSIPVLKNIFNPGIQAKSVDTGYRDVALSADRIALFILYYSCLLTRVIKLINNKNDEMIIVHLASSLLEPAWYKIIGPIPPVADTRIPTHTIFDHLAAVQTAILWTKNSREAKPNGCLAVVDLAGVQKWINESRRPRDLWAASWLVSYLAWASVKPLVEKYGPGILISPPIRLHPFYTAWLASHLNNKNNKEIQDLLNLLGLQTGWPIDPTIPSKTLLALPSEACSTFEHEVTRAYKKAWKHIIDRISQLLEEACKDLRDTLQEELDEDSVKDAVAACPILHLGKSLIAELEPPLAVKLLRVDLEDAWEKSLEIANSENIRKDIISKYNISLEDLARALFYSVADLVLLRKKESEIRIKAPGRRMGLAYAVFASRIMELARIGQARRSLCTVCGKGLTLVDGRVIDNVMRKLSLGKRKRVFGYSRGWVIREVIGERLCPYCLVKRLLSRMLQGYPGAEGFARELVGLEIPNSVREKLRWDSVTLFTARAWGLRSRIVEDARRLVEAARVEEDGGAMVSWLARRFGSAGDRDLVERVSREICSDGDEDCYGLVDDALSLVMEIYDSPGLIGSLIDEKENSLFNIINEIIKNAKAYAGRYRRKYAIIKMDGDNMGRGILRGALPLSTKLYVEKAYLIDNDKKKRLAEILEALTKEIYHAEQEAIENFEGRKPTILVSLSYHSSISRALAALAVVNRIIVESSKGTLIYTGGDDVLAIAPPVQASNDGSRIRENGLRTLLELRRAYWGLSRISSGVGKFFISLKSPDDNNILTITPALAGYGQTGALFLVDSHMPLWSTLTIAEGLEESKDNIKRRQDQNYMKDYMIIATDSQGPAVLPFKDSPPKEQTTSLAPEASIAIAIAEALSQANKKTLSTSIISDILSNTETLERIAGESLEAAKKFLDYLVDRNLTNNKKQSTRPTCKLPRLSDIQEKLCEKETTRLIQYQLEYKAPDRPDASQVWRAASLSPAWLLNEEDRESLHTRLLFQVFQLVKNLYTVLPSKTK